jgi:hypothetical protein
MATAIEYGLIAAGISVAIIAVVNGLGDTHPKTGFKPASQTTVQRAPFEERCPAYNDLKATHPDVHAYLASHQANLSKCTS